MNCKDVGIKRMKKRFPIFYLLAALDVILAVFRFVKGDISMGLMYLGLGFMFIVLESIDIDKEKKQKSDTYYRNMIGK